MHNQTELFPAQLVAFPNAKEKADQYIHCLFHCCMIWEMLYVRKSTVLMGSEQNEIQR